MAGTLGTSVQLGVLKLTVWLSSFPGRRLPFDAYRVLLRTLVRCP